jgi:hypothetical protein
MNSSDYLRLRTNPKPETPPQGNVDLFYDRAQESLVLRLPNGNSAVVQASGGRWNVALSSVISSDTDLTLTGATTGVDQSALIQPILNLALVRPLNLTWDVAVTAKSLLAYSNTRIDTLPGCGAKLPDGANAPILSNASYAAGAEQPDWETNPNFDAITKDHDIEVIGGIWHGNGGEQDHDSEEEGWHVGLRFFNVERLTLDRVTVLNPRTFAIHLCNASDVLIREPHIDCGASSVVNRDGIHINGNCERIQIIHANERTWDDAVGINADDLEHQGGVTPSVFGPYANFGPINDVIVDGLNLAEGRYGVRILSGQARVDRITLRNITGVHGGHLLLIDNYTEDTTALRNAGAGNIGTVVLDGVNVSCTGVSQYKQAIVFVSATIESLTLRNMTLAYDQTGVDFPPIKIGTTGTGVVCAISDLSIDNLKLLGPTGTESTPLTTTIVVGGNATVSKMRVRNTTVQRRSSKTQPIGALVTVESTAAITDLVINGVAAQHIAGNATLASSGAITRLDVKNSNIFDIVRGNSLTNLITRDARNPDTYNITGTDNEGSIHGIYGGGAMVSTDVVFSCIVKLPTTLAGSTSVSIGTRTIDWRVGSNACDGYTIDITATDVYLGKITTGFAFTSLAQRTVGLTVSEEYYLELRCVGTAISAYLQRLSDNLWLNTSATFQANRVAFGTATDSTYTGKWSHVKMYPGTSGGSKTARFRDIKHRPA